MLFNSSQYKSLAKNQLKGNIVFFLPVVFINIGFYVLNSYFSKPISKCHALNFHSFNLSFDIINDSVSIILFLIGAIIEIATSFFFLETVKHPETSSFSDWINGLNMWIIGICSSLWKLLWTTLWSFLFVIPGIIKTISYSQMNYILSENPNISINKAMKLSMVITKGYKKDLLYMYISFLGWIILTALTLGLLSIYTLPYIKLTSANAYLFMKGFAIKSNRLTLEDFQ